MRPPESTELPETATTQGVTRAANPAAAMPRHWLNYPRFLRHALSESIEGNWVFYLWMTVLTAVFLVGANAWAVQVRDGMQVTHMSDHVSWGLYIANFTFLVGLAAGGVMMVIPAYLYHDEEMHDLTLIGELLAIAALVTCGSSDDAPIRVGMFPLFSSPSSGRFRSIP
jgi:Ni/Fe-hydrogenase subunit HybB-like protein